MLSTHIFIKNIAFEIIMINILWSTSMAICLNPMDSYINLYVKLYGRQLNINLTRVALCITGAYTCYSLNLIDKMAKI
jgi:hypothetical protein